MFHYSLRLFFSASTITNFNIIENILERIKELNDVI